MAIFRLFVATLVSTILGFAQTSLTTIDRKPGSVASGKAVPRAGVNSRSSAAQPPAAKSGALKLNPTGGTGVSRKPGSRSGVKTRKSVAARRPPSQQQPSADRYQEIQEALAARGYFRGTADGTWGGDSVEALKRFQQDQNLDVDGKIGALSLIALGLGPKRSQPLSPLVKGSEPGDPQSTVRAEP